MSGYSSRPGSLFVSYSLTYASISGPAACSCQTTGIAVSEVASPINGFFERTAAISTKTLVNNTTVKAIAGRKENVRPLCRQDLKCQHSRDQAPRQHKDKQIGVCRLGIAY